MAEKAIFGGTWLGQSDRQTVDANPSVCVDQSNIWLGGQDLLQRRPSMTKMAIADNTTASTVGQTLIPVNTTIPVTIGSEGVFYPVCLYKSSNTTSGTKYALIYIKSDGTLFKVKCPFELSELVGNAQPAATKVAMASIAGQQVVINQTPQPFLLFGDDNPASTNNSVQMMSLVTENIYVNSGQPCFSALTPVNVTGGGLNESKWFWFTGRFELIDANGIMRMCTQWSEPQVHDVTAGNNAITLSTFFHWASAFGIAYNSDPTALDQVDVQWGQYLNAGWKYRLSIARTMESSVTGTFEDGPYYLVESSTSDTWTDPGQIVITAKMADSELQDKIDRWVGMDAAYDVVAVNGVYVWIKSAATGSSQSLVCWGTAEYPYLAYTSSFVPVEKDSYLVRIDPSIVACIGQRKIKLIYNLPETPTVEEYILPAVISPGAVWYANGSVYGQGVDGRVYDISQRQPVSDVVPWLKDSNQSTYRSQPTFLGDVTVIQKMNLTTSVVTSYAIRYVDNAIWKLPNGFVGVDSSISNSDVHRYWQLRLINGVKGLMYSDAAIESSLEDTDPNKQYDLDPTLYKTPIVSYWQSSWQSFGTSQLKTIRGVEISQEPSSECTVLVEGTNHPETTAADTSHTFTFDQVKDVQSYNIANMKYYRIKISSIDGKPFNIRNVTLHYDVITAKDGLN